MEGNDLSFHVTFAVDGLLVYLDVVLSVHNRHRVEFLVMHIGQSTQYFPHMQLEFLVVYGSEVEEMGFSIVDYFFDFAVVALQDEGQLALLLEGMGQLGYLFAHILDCQVQLTGLISLFCGVLLLDFPIVVIYCYLIDSLDYFQLAFLVLHVYIYSNPQNYYNIHSLFPLIIPYFPLNIAQATF